MRATGSARCRRAPALVLAGARPGDRGEDLPLAQRAALMGAPVAQREELAVDVEHADRATADLDDLAPARRDLADPGDRWLAIAEPVQRMGVVAHDPAPAVVARARRIARSGESKSQCG